MPSFPQPFMVRATVLSSSQSWKTETGSRMKPPKPQEKWSVTCYTYKSTELDGIHPRPLRQLPEMLTEPLSVISQCPWLTGKAPASWWLANMMSIYEKDHKEDPGSCKPVLSAAEGHGTDYLKCHQVVDRCRTTRKSGPATMTLWKAGPAWPRRSPSMTERCTW